MLNRVQYRNNSQACVVVFEARMRGYDVEAMGYQPGTIFEKLAKNTNIAWIDPKTGKYPEYIMPDRFGGVITPTKYLKYLDETLKEGGRYTLEFEWRKQKSGHIVHIFKDKQEIKIYDPQTGEIENNLKKYLGEIKFTRCASGFKYSIAPKLLEVGSYNFNLKIVNKILIKAGT